MRQFRSAKLQFPTTHDDVTQQQTVALPVLKATITNIDAPSDNTELDPGTSPPPEKGRSSEQQTKQQLSRTIAIGLIIGLAIGLYFVWRPTTSATSPPITSTTHATSPISNTTTTLPTTPTPNPTDIQVYVVGAVKKPGVYTLPFNARMYQLLEAAGGPLPEANLVAVNLAQRVSDGQEIYIPRVGERLPVAGGSGSTAGGLVNINTASADELREKLSVSSQTAQSIITYREQHGAYTSVETLQQAVSKTIYTKIKELVTV